MNVKEVLGAFLLVNNPIVLSEEETKDVQKAIKQLQQENKKYKEIIDKAIKFIYYSTKYRNSEDIYQFIIIHSSTFNISNNSL